MTWAWAESAEKRHPGIDFSGWKEYGSGGIGMHARKN